jgi:ubiquinone/menaquinone biosynthesis C-methylase UbiE
MTAMASKKYRRAGITHVTFEKRAVQELEIPPETLDLAICVNALYAFPDRSNVLRKLHRWLKPQAVFFVIDLGREMKVAEWTSFILSSSVQEAGLAQTILRLWKGRHAISQNSAIRANQLTGTYWLHHSRDFVSALREAGFEVLESGICYRGYCDFAVCMKGKMARRV